MCIIAHQSARSCRKGEDAEAVYKQDWSERRQAEDEGARSCTHPHAMSVPLAQPRAAAAYDSSQALCRPAIDDMAITERQALTAGCG